MDKVSSFSHDSIVNGLTGGDGSESSTAARDGARRSTDSETAPAMVHPDTHRGVEFGVHWLSVTFFVENETAAVDALKQLLQDMQALSSGYRLGSSGGRGFDQIEHGDYGHKVYYEHRSSKDACVSVELPGKFVEAIGMRNVREFLIRAPKITSAIRWQVTRIDLAFDTTAFTVKQCVEAVEAKQFRSLVKRKARANSDTESSSFKYERDLFAQADIFRIGSRTSTRYLRFYERITGFGSLSGKRCVRAELECKDKRANAIALQLLEADFDSWAKIAVSHLRDFIDFHTEWWSVFTELAERAHLTLNQKLTAAERAERSTRWFKKQIAPSMAAQVVGRGGDMSWIENLLNAGQRRFGERHFALIQALHISQVTSRTA